MKHYCVEKKICSCKKCKNIFVDIIPFGYELVCFNKESIEKVFLPTYGENGYLELLKKLVPEWDDTQEITYKISKIFENRINNYTPYKVSNYNKTECPKCKSDAVGVIKRNTEANYPIKWIEIDTAVLK